MTGNCDDCAYNVYDDEMDEYVCEAYLDRLLLFNERIKKIR